MRKCVSAVKYTNRGRITVKVGNIDNSRDEYAFIEATDTGIDKIDHYFIWKEFRQFSEGHSRSCEGTGLGVTISKKFIGKQNGSISLESELGRRLIFTIKVPLKPSEKNNKGSHVNTAEKVRPGEVLYLA